MQRNNSRGVVDFGNVFKCCDWKLKEARRKSKEELC